MIACIASTNKVPVVIFSETYKFSDKVNLDQISNKEIGNPGNVVNSYLKNKSPNV